MWGAVYCFKVNAFSFSEVFPSACLDRLLLLLLLVVRRAKVSLKRLLSHVECHSQYLDRRSWYRPVVLYARRCFFWDSFLFLFSEMGARSLCEQGRWRHDEDPAVFVRGDAPCCRGRAVAVDHLPMAMKESVPVFKESLRNLFLSLRSL